MEILVTGARGFIGRNFIAYLKQYGYTDILEYDIDTGIELLDEYAGRCGFVAHLAGVNRPENSEEFMKGNADFTRELLDALKRHANKAPILLSSSIQAALDNSYGQSKRVGERLVLAHAEETGSMAFIYRLPNVFGKWCRPDYNSAVATFCYNIARGLPIAVNDPETVMRLVYIDDVAREFLRALEGYASCNDEYCSISPIYTVKLGEIVTLLENFRDGRINLLIPDLSDPFTRKLYATYLSFLSEDDFSYPLKMHVDSRGSFTEFLRMPERGQVSINVSKPSVIKGNHWHHTKNEKFLVVKGEGIVRFRAPESGIIIEYRVSGQELCAIDIPPGYTHNIENIGSDDMITVMWASECFDPEYPDTYALEV